MRVSVLIHQPNMYSMALLTIPVFLFGVFVAGTTCNQEICVADQGSRFFRSLDPEKKYKLVSF